MKVQWRQNGNLITKTTHPNFSPSIYRGPAGFLYHALDIKDLSTATVGEYSITAINLGGIVRANFNLALAGE